jgi:hypothetical protein
MVCKNRGRQTQAEPSETVSRINLSSFNLEPYLLFVRFLVIVTIKLTHTVGNSQSHQGLPPSSIWVFLPENVLWPQECSLPAQYAGLNFGKLRKVLEVTLKH